MSVSRKSAKQFPLRRSLTFHMLLEVLFLGFNNIRGPSPRHLVVSVSRLYLSVSDVVLFCFCCRLCFRTSAPLIFPEILVENDFTGEIPSHIGSATSLKELSVSKCFLNYGL
jgi:hypothetical protein